MNDDEFEKFKLEENEPNTSRFEIVKDPNNYRQPFNYVKSLLYTTYLIKLYFMGDFHTAPNSTKLNIG